MKKLITYSLICIALSLGATSSLADCGNKKSGSKSRGCNGGTTIPPTETPTGGNSNVNTVSASANTTSSASNTSNNALTNTNNLNLSNNSSLANASTVNSSTTANNTNVNAGNSVGNTAVNAAGGNAVATGGSAAGGAGGMGGSATGGAGGMGGTGGTSALTNTGNSTSVIANTATNTGTSEAAAIGNSTRVELTTINEAKKIPAATATAPYLTSSGDTCMGSTSAGAQGAAIGLSFGTTWVDENCVMLKNARELWNMGLPHAALARMCMDMKNREALELTGLECPQTTRAKKASPKQVHVLTEVPPASFGFSPN